MDSTTCCIVGGGPAGLMLGLLLARSGVAVTVLEKHADFLRDFRGDTIHPSTLGLIEELGFFDELDRIPHDVVHRLRANVNGQWLTLADLTLLEGRHPHIFMMPQWDFLALLARKAAEQPTFQLETSAEATDLLLEGKLTRGVVYRRARGELRALRADLTVACDGRGSTLRARRGARPVEIGAPMDVLWFRLARRTGDASESHAVLRASQMLVLIHRGAYWQAGYLIPKGEDRRVRGAGIASFRDKLAAMVPAFGDGRLEELSWEHVFTLSVQVNHLLRWFYPGLLFLGDAAHAMSPIGGVGINLALQDAVAAARILAAPLREGRLSTLDLARVQARRAPPAALTQLAQTIAQRRIIRPVLAGRVTRPPLRLAMLLTPRVQAFAARAIGIGLVPEHWRT